MVAPEDIGAFHFGGATNPLPKFNDTFQELSKLLALFEVQHLG